MVFSEMKKIEQIYREMLFQGIEKGKNVLTQSELAKSTGVSLSTVNLAVKKLGDIGAVVISNRNFRITDIKKILYYWASIRNFGKDILYKARVEMPVREIEKNLPDVFYACFSAYKFKFKEVPADYSEVYVYASDKDVGEIKKRFSGKELNPNLIVLNEDENMKKFGKTLTIGQIFVDLWNLNKWYAKDFLDSLDLKLNKEFLGK
jgi:DNA-binding transcriptional regulator YhcF (GntR family)